MIVQAHKGRPFYTKEDGLVTGFVPAIPVESKEHATIQWHGSRIPQKLYMQTVAFAKWCMEKYGGEVQGRLYYSEKRNKWRVVILPQYISRNLHSEEIEHHPLREKALQIVSDGDWVQNGTWHSHGFAGAGQSQTDYDDEIKQSGFHYTVGSLRANKSTFHCRFCFRGHMYTESIDPSQFIKKPVVYTDKCNSFPEQWKTMLIEKPVVKKVHTPSSHSQGVIFFGGRRFTREEWSEFVASGMHRGEHKSAGNSYTAYGRIDDDDDEYFIRDFESESQMDFFGNDDGIIFNDEYTIDFFNELMRAYRCDESILRAIEYMLCNLTGEANLRDSIADLIEYSMSRR
jgi:hypothetical protein